MRLVKIILAPVIQMTETVQHPGRGKMAVYRVHKSKRLVPGEIHAVHPSKNAVEIGWMVRRKWG
jgi:hypothetical protein